MSRGAPLPGQGNSSRAEMIHRTFLELRARCPNIERGPPWLTGSQGSHSRRQSRVAVDAKTLPGRLRISPRTARFCLHNVALCVPSKGGDNRPAVSDSGSHLWGSTHSGCSPTTDRVFAPPPVTSRGRQCFGRAPPARMNVRVAWSMPFLAKPTNSLPRPMSSRFSQRSGRLTGHPN